VLLKFISRSILFAAILYPIFFFLQRVTDKTLLRSRFKEYSVWNDIYASKINADLIIVGSSRAVAHVSSPILDSALHINSYNLGMEAYDFKMQYARMRVYLQHNTTPKYVLTGLDVFSLYKRDSLYHPQQFLPFLHDSIIRNACNGYGGEFSFLTDYIPYFKYHAEPEITAETYSILFDKQHYFAPPDPRKGYTPYDGNWDGAFDRFKLAHPKKMIQEINDYQIRELENYLADCQNRGIKNILLYTPEYWEIQESYENRPDIIALYKKLALKYNATFLDYSNDPICHDKSKFFNSQHLNKLGSEIFTRKLANDLKNQHLVQSN